LRGRYDRRGRGGACGLGRDHRQSLVVGIGG
jgi:hypothetical protein